MQRSDVADEEEAFCANCKCKYAECDRELPMVTMANTFWTSKMYGCFHKE